MDTLLRTKKFLLSLVADTRAGRAQLLKVVGEETSSLLAALGAIVALWDSREAPAIAKRTLKLSAKAALLVSSRRISAHSILSLQPPIAVAGTRLVALLEASCSDAAAALVSATVAVMAVATAEAVVPTANAGPFDVLDRGADADIIALSRAMRAVWDAAIPILSPHVTPNTIRKATALGDLYCSSAFLAFATRSRIAESERVSLLKALRVFLSPKRASAPRITSMITMTRTRRSAPHSVMSRVHGSAAAGGGESSTLADPPPPPTASEGDCTPDEFPCLSPPPPPPTASATPSPRSSPLPPALPFDEWLAEPARVDALRTWMGTHSASSSFGAARAPSRSLPLTSLAALARQRSDKLLMLRRNTAFDGGGSDVLDAIAMLDSLSSDSATNSTRSLLSNVTALASAGCSHSGTSSPAAYRCSVCSSQPLTQGTAAAAASERSQGALSSLPAAAQLKLQDTSVLECYLDLTEFRRGAIAQPKSALASPPSGLDHRARSGTAASAAAAALGTADELYFRYFGPGGSAEVSSLVSAIAAQRCRLDLVQLRMSMSTGGSGSAPPPAVQSPPPSAGHPSSECNASSAGAGDGSASTHATLHVAAAGDEARAAKANAAALPACTLFDAVIAELHTHLQLLYDGPFRLSPAYLHAVSAVRR